MQDNILQSVGQTPLVRLRRVTEGLPAAVYVKVESLNPGGSVKDRVGRGHDRRGRAARLAAARRHHHRSHRRQHRRRPGHGRRRQGLSLHLRPARQDEQREDRAAQGLRRRGRHHADQRRRPIRRTATTASPTGWPARSPAPGGPTSSPTSPTPKSTTAPPARKSGSRPRAEITAFVAGVGTGGTISGVGRYLKEQNPDIKIIGADPEGSVLSGGTPQPWKVEGIGEDFVPKTFNSQLVDDWVRVGDAESFHIARELARREGMLLGGSSGTTVAAALRYARRLTGDASGRRPRRRHGPQLPEQVLRRRLAGREQADAGRAAAALDRRPAAARAASGNW